MPSQSRTSSTDSCWAETNPSYRVACSNSSRHACQGPFCPVWWIRWRLDQRFRLRLIRYELCRQCESLLFDRFLDQPIFWNRLSCLRAHLTHNIRNRWLLIHLFFFLGDWYESSHVMLLMLRSCSASIYSLKSMTNCPSFSLENGPPSWLLTLIIFFNISLYYSSCGVAMNDHRYVTSSHYNRFLPHLLMLK